MRRIISWLSWQKFVLFVVLVVTVYQSRLSVGQSLIGWDSVMPELGWELNFARALTGAWQEYQGLGLAGGMAHLADLSRIIILWCMHFIVPADYLRWAWHMGMLVLGPIGVWYLGKKLWKWSESACLSASMFYLLNLATVQYFFVPYESFSSFYGFLPWLIAVFLSYIEYGRKDDLWNIVILGLLGSSAFYVQTLFVVYLVVLGLLSLGYLHRWRRIVAGFVVVFSANMFWFLPVLYGIVQNGGLVGLAKINSIASPETVLMNSAFGNWQNVSLLKGYWLEYIEWLGGENWGRLMSEWWMWNKQVGIEYLGFGLFGLCFIGILMSSTKRKASWPWMLGLLLTYVMVASFNNPFGYLYQLLVEKIPLFGEMFRSGFTKWSIVMALFLAVGIGSLVSMIKGKLTSAIVALIVVGCSIGIVWPVFSTGLIFDKMKVDTPNEYSTLFEYLAEQPKTVRMTYLPTQSMWSWKYQDWGYRGSGFLWYGIEQPILDRAFDVWSPYNEGFYDEFSNALYSVATNQQTNGTAKSVQRVLDKYDVRYVLLDESVIAPGQGREILRIDETKKIAGELGWRQVFQEGFLTVWDTGEQTDNFVSAPGSYTVVDTDAEKVRMDVAWEGVGTYVSDNQKTQSVGESDNSESRIVYPFAGLMREEISGVEYGVNSMRLTADGVQEGQELVIPGWQTGDIVRINYLDGKPLPAYKINGQNGPVFRGKEKPEEGKSYIVARVSEGDEWEEYRAEREYRISNIDKIEIEVEGGAETYDFAKQGQVTIGNCDVLKRGTVQKIGANYSADERGAVCDYIVMPELDTRLSYLMRMQGENEAGRSLKFFLYNTGSKRSDLEYLLGKHTYDQTFSLLPWEFDGNYTLNIETRSFGQYAENKVSPVEVRWLPLEQIAGVRITPSRSDLVGFENDLQPTRSDLQIVEVKKYGTWLYIVETKNGGLLKLSQGYDEGWVSPWIEHVKVDGWANGWMVPAGQHQIVIFYWPQLLEYLGFVILGVTIIVLVRHKD